MSAELRALFNDTDRQIFAAALAQLLVCLFFLFPPSSPPLIPTLARYLQKGAPLDTPVEEDHFFFLTETQKYRFPALVLPPQLHNHGNYIISLGMLVKWLGEQAEQIGVEIFPGFAADQVIYRKDGSVAGIATKDSGIGKDGKPKENFTPGIELRARQTLFAEGCRGSCSEAVMKKFNLKAGKEPQTITTS